MANSWRPRTAALALGLVLAGLDTIALQAADASLPKPPQTSSFAAVAPLEAQIDRYLADLGLALATESDFAEKRDRIKMDANTLAALAVAAGLHESPNKYRQLASGILPASLNLAKAADYAAAQAAWSKLQAASKDPAAEKSDLTWGAKVASLGQMMKQAGNLNSKLGRGLRRFDREAEANLQAATVLAVIGQAAVVDTHEVKNPAEIPLWYQMAGEFRDASATLATAIQAKDPQAAELAFKRVSQSCDRCHEKFHQE